MKVSKNGDQNKLNISLDSRRLAEVNAICIDQNKLNINLDGRRKEEVNAYRCLGVDVTNDGKMNEEVNHRIGEAEMVSGGLQKLWKKSCVTREAKVGMYEVIVELSLCACA